MANSEARRWRGDCDESDSPSGWRAPEPEVEVGVETVADLLARQVVVPEWIRQAVAGLAPEARVRVVRRWALGAAYVLAVEVSDGDDE